MKDVENVVVSYIEVEVVRNYPSCVEVGLILGISCVCIRPSLTKVDDIVRIIIHIYGNVSRSANSHNILRDVRRSKVDNMNNDEILVKTIDEVVHDV